MLTVNWRYLIVIYSLLSLQMHFMLRLISTLTNAHAFERFIISKCLLHPTIQWCKMLTLSTVAELLIFICMFIYWLFVVFITLNIKEICFWCVTDFSFQAQKPWAKKLAKVQKGRKEYHGACKVEKSVVTQLNTESASNPEQVCIHNNWFVYDSVIQILTGLVLRSTLKNYAQLLRGIHFQCWSRLTVSICLVISLKETAINSKRNSNKFLSFK